MSYARILRRTHARHRQIPPPKTLEAYNETLDSRQLHPTKGYRPTSARRSRAQIIMSMVKARQWPWSSRAMQEFI